MADYGQAITQAALSFVGTLPYKARASVSDTANHIAADCSSFVQYIYTVGKVDLPRGAGDQAQATETGGLVKSALGGSYDTGTSIAASDLKPGDLLFFGGFNTPDNPPGYHGIQHVGIYAGNGMFVHEGGDPSGVSTAKLSDYSAYFIEATRPNPPKDTSTTNPIYTSTNLGGTAKSDSSGNPLTDLGGGIGNLISNPLGTASDIAGNAAGLTGIPAAIQNIGFFIGIVMLALILIIGGIVLIRPQTAGDAGKAAGMAAMA